MARLNREESQARTRDLLVQAARDEIVRKGFAQATVRDIADVAGFSQGAFYSNFPSKEAILLEVARRHQTEERAKIEVALGQAPGHGADVMKGIERWAANINTDPGWAILAVELQLQALRNPSFAVGYNALNREHFVAMGTLIARLFNLLGKAVPGDPVEVAAGFIALGRGMALLSQQGNAGWIGRTIVTFLDAVIKSAQPSRDGQ